MYNLEPPKFDLDLYIQNYRGAFLAFAGACPHVAQRVRD